MSLCQPTTAPRPDRAAAAAHRRLGPRGLCVRLGLLGLPGLLGLVTACGTPAPHPGQTEAELRAQMGPAAGRYPLAGGGQRLEFARGPAGRLTWMVDLDAAGRALRSEQVLDAAHFAQVQPGMAADDLLRLLGRPAAKQGEWQQRETWSWRYETNDCLWFRVTLGADRRVQHGGAYMTDPACDTNAGADRK